MDLRAGDVAVAVDSARGGRVASLRVAGHELLVAEPEVGDPKLWGCYPMGLVCVEPQTAAPDAFNRDPKVVEPGRSLRARLEISWSSLT